MSTPSKPTSHLFLFPHHILQLTPERLRLVSLFPRINYGEMGDAVISNQFADLIKAPKITANAAKQATILAWFHKTAVAHSIKDLEKAIPPVASINGMQVKDYLQALSDDNKIRVEKIGSGNWYWSFPSDEKKAKEAMLEKAQEEFGKANATLTELQAKVDEAGAAREEDEDMLMETG